MFCTLRGPQRTHCSTPAMKTRRFFIDGGMDFYSFLCRHIDYLTEPSSSVLSYSYLVQVRAQKMGRRKVIQYAPLAKCTAKGAKSRAEISTFLFLGRNDLEIRS